MGVFQWPALARCDDCGEAATTIIQWTVGGPLIQKCLAHAPLIAFNTAGAGPVYLRSVAPSFRAPFSLGSANDQ